MKYPNPDTDIRQILQFLEGYPRSKYPRTPDSDKDSKNMDPSDKDPYLNTLKYSGYPNRHRPILNVHLSFHQNCISHYFKTYYYEQTQIKHKNKNSRENTIKEKYFF